MTETAKTINRIANVEEKPKDIKFNPTIEIAQIIIQFDKLKTRCTEMIAMLSNQLADKNNGSSPE